MNAYFLSNSEELGTLERHCINNNLNFTMRFQLFTNIKKLHKSND